MVHDGTARRAGHAIHRYIYRYIPIYTDTYRYIPIYTDTSRYIPIYTDIYRYIPIYPDVQEAPMVRLNVLDMLLKMAARRGKRECQKRPTIGAKETYTDMYRYIPIQVSVSTPWRLTRSKTSLRTTFSPRTNSSTSTSSRCSSYRRGRGRRQTSCWCSGTLKTLSKGASVSCL